MTIQELKELAREVRRDIILMLTKAGSGHPGGSLSCVEILVTLYSKVMRHDPNNQKWEDRDRFVLSKGHAAPTLYALLAKAGYFPREWLWKLRKCGSPLQGHPYPPCTPGVECATGSLGHGLSIANGMAIAGKLDNKPYKVYCLIGDGEINEGQIWEASMSAARFKLDNLCAILDHNGLQIDGTIREIKNPYPLREKWEAFGWQVMEVSGHSFEELIDAFSKFEARLKPRTTDMERLKPRTTEVEKLKPRTTKMESNGKPTIIIANTVKGKGISFMENAVNWHGKAPNKEQAIIALKDLGYGEEDFSL